MFPEETQILVLLDKDFKSSILSIVKKSKINYE